MQNLTIKRLQLPWHLASLMLTLNLFVSVSACWADSWTQGTKRLLYMRVAFPDFPAEPISESDAQELMTQVNQWMVEGSYGSFSLQWEVTPLLILPQTKEYYAQGTRETLQSDARNAAKAVGFDASNYELEIIRHNNIPGSQFINWVGFSTVGGKGIWMQTSGLGNTIHELGHNLGVGRANSWGASGDSIIGMGTNVDYGNPFDMMGNPSAIPWNYHFNTELKNQLDWLSFSHITTVKTSGTYRIYAFDTSNLLPSRQYAVQVKKDFTRNYWLEMREKITTNTWLQNGILLGWNPWNNFVGNSFGNTHLLDTTPGTPTGNQSKDDAALVVGRTFADAAAGLYITSLLKGTDAGENWMDIRVNMGDFSTNVAPTLGISVSQTNVALNQSVAFQATAADANGDAMAFYWEFGDLSFGSNAPVAVKSWATSGDYVVRCTVSDMKGGITTRQILVTVGAPGTYQIYGRITNSLGQPLEGVRVYNKQTDSAYRGTYTDSDGAYILGNLTAGSVDLAAVKYGYELKSAGWVAPVLVSGSVQGLDWGAATVSGVSIAATDLVATESAAFSDKGRFTITRTGSLASNLVVKVNLSGTAHYIVDYDLSPSPTYGTTLQFTLPINVAATNIDLLAYDDGFSEGPAIVTMTLLEDATYVLAGTAEATVTILDAQPAGKPTVSIVSQTLSLTSDDASTEATSDTGYFYVSRDSQVQGNLTVYYSISGTANNGTDYQTLGNSVVIPAGEQGAMVPITAIDDALVEGNESVVLTLVADAGYNVSTNINVATVMIMEDDPTRVSILATRDVVNGSITTQGMFTITRAGNLKANLTVYYQMSGSAINGVDYQTLAGQVTILAGQTYTNIAVTMLPAAQSAGEKSVVAQLTTSPSYDVGGSGSATIRLLGTQYPTINLIATNPNASEAGPLAGSFLFTRTGSTNNSLTVYYDIYGTAENGLDYQTIANSIVIPAGTSNAAVSIMPIADGVKEALETVTLVLETNLIYAIGATSLQTVTIADNDASGPVGVSFALPYSSGMEGRTSVVVNVTLSVPSTTNVSVGYFASGGTAIGGGVDYDLPPGVLVFPAGITNKSFSFYVTNDFQAELNETVVITLTNATNAVVFGNTNHIYTIIDDDSSGDVTVTAVNATASEAGPVPGVFRIARTIATNADLTVFFQITGTANAPSDYAPLPTFITITNGQSYVDLTISPVDDNVAEPVETVIMTLTSVTGGRIGSPSKATITILDNDSVTNLPLVRISASASQIMETNGANPVVVTISRDSQTNVALAVTFTLGGSASNGVDYVGMTNWVTIAAGETNATLAVVPLADFTIEPSKTVILTLTALNTYRVAPLESSVTVEIVDNSAGMVFTVPTAGVTMTNQHFIVQIEPEPGRGYWLEKATNLINPVWQVVAGVTNGVGTTNLVDFEASGDKGFYRVGVVFTP